jgi:hypothetical protein
MEKYDRFIVWFDNEGGWHSCLVNSDADERKFREEMKEPILDCERIWTVFIPEHRRGCYESYRGEAIKIARTRKSHEF